MPGPGRLALCGGVALYWLGLAAFRWRIAEEKSPGARGGAALIVLYAVGGSIPGVDGGGRNIGADRCALHRGGTGGDRSRGRLRRRGRRVPGVHLCGARCQLGVERPMRVVITGATGTIGLAVADALRSRGDEVVALTRDPERGRSVLGDGAEVHPGRDRPMSRRPRRARRRRRDHPPARRTDRAALDRRGQGADPRLPRARDQLAGHGAQGAPRGRSAAGARVAVGDRLLRRPRGRRLDEQAPPGDDFLAGVVVAWEREAQGVGRARGSRARAPAWCCHRAAERWRRCCPSSSSGSEGRWRAGISTSLDPSRRRGRRDLRCVDDRARRGAVNVTSPDPVTNARAVACARARARPAGGAAGPGDRGQSCSTGTWRRW